MRNIGKLAGLCLAIALTSACAAAVVGGAAQGTYARDDGRSQATLAEDARISSEVKKLIYRDNSLLDEQISVSTRNGIVTLSGRVSGQEALRRAAGLAKSVDGVKGIDMQLIICGHGTC